MLLAGLSEEQLDHYFRTYLREQMTPFTVTDEAKLRALIDEVREQGWALNDRELDPGTRSIAAPVVSPSGRQLNAVNVSVPTSRVLVVQLIHKILPELLKTTAKISSDFALISNRSRFE